MRVIGPSLVTSLLLAGCASVPERHSVAPFVRPAPLAQTTTTQLPRVARPSHYAISVTPDLAKQRFAGTSRIDLTIFETTNAIVMNAANLAITEATLCPPLAARPHRCDSRWTTGPDGVVPVGRTDCARSLHAVDNVHRQDQHPGQRAVRARLHRQAHRQDARAVHPVRGARRAPLRAHVRRAELQGDVRPLGDRPRRPDGGQQHADRARRNARRTGASG